MPAPTPPVQGRFDDLGTPLHDVTFVIVDLETTGGAPSCAAITEIGAVKVRGGEVLAELQTLVNPIGPIPAFIAVLTGITDAMVAGAPRLAAVLPAFLEFLGDPAGTVLVAHNAPFDVGFLRAGATALGYAWPSYRVIDTARLARRVLTRDETPDCKLSSLSRLFAATTTPCHRALADARATVDVLHGLIGRVGSLGVSTIEELASFSTAVSPAQRRKRHLADPLPHAPGVYLFRDAGGEILYVGTSHDLRSRVRQYFTAAEQRSAMAEMVGLAQRVDHVECAHALEAQVGELRLIAAHKPRYNRRSRFPERAVWLKLTIEAFPRLSVVLRRRADGATYLGPFGTRRTAELALAALHDAVPLRQCTARLSPRRSSPACVLAEMGRCGAPCQGGITRTAYDEHADLVRRAVQSDPRPVTDRLLTRITALAQCERFEDAALHRDRLAALVRALARQQRLLALAQVRLLVAARRADHGGWELAVVRHGRLAAAGLAPPGAAPQPYLDALLATATDSVRDDAAAGAGGPTPYASAAEMECVLRWLELPGARLVELDGAWCSPARGAGGLLRLVDAAAADHAGVRPLGDRRRLRPVARPARGAG